MPKDFIYLSPPHMGSHEKKFLDDAFDSNWIAPLGPHVDLFEDEISSYMNIKDATALSSGTAAIHLALKIANVSNNDVVLCPSLTFVASASPILYQNACPVFLDSDENTWTLDCDALDIAIKKFKPKALIAVDIYGHSCDYDQIKILCEKNNVFLIEDAAEALGSQYKKKKCGTYGDIGILSFNGNKIITSSGGGMLLSDNPDFTKKAKFLSTQSREDKIHYEHKEIGYNYRLSNLLAAVGRGQLRVLSERIKKKRRIFDYYQKSLSKIEGISFLKESKNTYSNRWLTTMLVDSKVFPNIQKEIIKNLEMNGIESRPVWKPMHMQPLFKSYKYISSSKDDISNKLFKEGICLPSGTELSNYEQDLIIDIIFSTIKKQ